MEPILCFIPLLISLLSFSATLTALPTRGQAEALTLLYRTMFRTGFHPTSSPLPPSSFESIEDITFQDSGSSKDADHISGRLPGQPPVTFQQYGGYVTVNTTNGRALYYYFVEADRPHNGTLPLLLWLNGGPGCSSLGYGAMEEVGPFRVKSDGKTLYRNPYSWNKAANLLFLESPAGVGFSYSNTSTDYEENGDKMTAVDNYVFLLGWLERFPEYKERDFFIAGESYAGHYIPQLAHTILLHNLRAGKSIINLKGILVGNGIINHETDQKGMYDFLADHALTSQEAVSRLHKFCDFSPTGTFTTDCETALVEVEEDIDNIDIYNIYAPRCSHTNLSSTTRHSNVRRFDPCTDNFVLTYLNRPDVQNSLHVYTMRNVSWKFCGLDTWTDSTATVIPQIKDLMINGIRVWIFSGDVDGRVPVTSTQYSIKSMKIEVDSPWRPWFSNGEVGGYTEGYRGGLTFATVRGAGHMVPSYKPERAFSLVTHFLADHSLPRKQQ